jgi:hypothetical protein
MSSRRVKLFKLAAAPKDNFLSFTIIVHFKTPVHKFMNAAKIVNIFGTAKLFVQKIMSVHKFMNNIKIMNRKHTIFLSNGNRFSLLIN